MRASLPHRSFFPILLCLLGITHAALAENVDDHLFSGSKFVQEKKYAEAIREFEVAVSLDPKSPKANWLMALTLAKTGDLDRAIEYCLKTAEIEPGYSVYYELGLIYSNQGKFEKAVGSFEQALKFNAKSYMAWHQLGKVYAATLQFEKAAGAYQKAAELNSKFPDAYQGMGSVYYWSGDLTKALQQVDALNKIGFPAEAVQLERWIKDKESKRKRSEKKAGVKKPV